MLNFMKWFKGCILVSLHLWGYFQSISCQGGCNETKTPDGKYRADCSWRHFTSAPDKLHGSDLIYLDISRNEIKQLTMEDAKRYPNLIELRMTDLVQNIRCPAEFFVSFKHLEKLDISRTGFEVLILMPESLRVLIAEQMHAKSFKTIDMKPSINLEEVYLSSNALGSFPKLSSHAPLKVVNLSNNILLEWEPIQMASFCQLKKVIAEGSTIEADNAFTHRRCCEIKHYFTTYNVENDLKCYFTSEISSADSEKGCNKTKFQIDPVILSSRNLCLNRLKYSPIYKALIVAFFLILVTLVALYFIWHHYKNKPPSESESVASSSVISETMEEEGQLFDENMDPNKNQE